MRRVVAQLDAHLEEPLLDCLARDADGDPCLQAASRWTSRRPWRCPAATSSTATWPGRSPRTPDEVGTWGVATDHPRIVAASSGGTVRGGAVSGLGGYAAARHLLDAR